ncbi:uncharacterized protein LOC126316725 [Schistocerca gregaria]|uniref:uncharacterized protein LOC126316725 n=1 Tax=Schistocerca gregaria TaxID=7010 RepID=UPI00211F07A1|nr:uncharacterized protein LOC126316725 [Schistocerca gregaria]
MLPSKPRGNTKELYRYFTSDLFSSGLHLWRKPMARLYQFRFLPLGFFGRLIFQVLQMPSIQVLGYWKRGVLIKSKRGEHCYCIYNDTTYELLIFVQVLSLGHEAGKEYAAFNALISCVDTLIDNNMYGRRLNIFVPCSHCIELDLPNPTLFPVESCILNMIDNAGQSLICLQSSPSIPPKRRSYLDFFSRKSQYRPQENLDEKRAAKKNRVPLSKLATDLALTSFSDRLVSFDQLCMGKKIAEGGFSTVYSATLLGKTVAVKMFHSHQQQSADFLAESFRELQHEVFLINQLRHANIVELRNFCTNPLCIIFDFYDLGSLNQYLVEKKKVFTWSERLRIALDIAEGLAYLHRQDMIHRDLRSHNILINSWDVRDMQVPVAKLTDFGLAAIICGSFQGVKEYNECWTAPEVMKRSRYSHKVDIYSFGIVCWELLQIGFPFQEYHEELGAPFRSELEEKIIGGLRPTIGKNVHPAYKNLIERCWQDKPEERPDGVELVHMLRAMIEENEQAPWDDS